MTGTAHSLDLRKLAAIDILFLGSKFVIAEYAAGVLLPTALGVLTLRNQSSWQIAAGIYLICLGIDYIPMLSYAIAIGGRERAQAEVAGELGDKRRAMSKYRRQSLLLLVPLFAAILAISRKYMVSGDAI